MFSVYRELESIQKLFTRKLPNIMYYTKFQKNFLRHVKTTTLYLYLEQELHIDKLFYKAYIPLGDNL